MIVNVYNRYIILISILLICINASTPNNHLTKDSHKHIMNNGPFNELKISNITDLIAATSTILPSTITITNATLSINNQILEVNRSDLESSERSDDKEMPRNETSNGTSTNTISSTPITL